MSSPHLGCFVSGKLAFNCVSDELLILSFSNTDCHFVVAELCTFSTVSQLKNSPCLLVIKFYSVV